MTQLGTQPRKVRSLFWRILLRLVSVKRPQTALAIASLGIGAAVTSMLLNLYGDAQRKMTQEFRAYGPNLILAPKPLKSSATPVGSNLDSPARMDWLISGELMEEQVLTRLERFKLRQSGLEAWPMLYVVMRLGRVPSDRRLPEFQDAVAVGTDFSALRRLYPSWHVAGAAGSLDLSTCAVGAHLASELHLGVGDSLELSAGDRGPGTGSASGETCRVSAVVTTGVSEDDQVFVPLRELQGLAGLEGKISLVEVSVPGEAAEVNRLLVEFAQAFPDLDVRPVRQLLYSQGKVLDTIRWLMVSLTALILVTIALCVAATMTTIVLERRRDIAVMKALGASNQAVMQLLLSEGAGLGLAGGALGFFLGVLLARHLVQRLFGVTLHLVGWALPVVCISSVLLGALATFFPLQIVRAIQPATVLKGE